MPCIHCGLPTKGEESHGTMEECIQALIAETMRLKKAIAETPQPGDIAGPRSSPIKKSDFAGS
jgi:hypothetical protein